MFQSKFACFLLTCGATGWDVVGSNCLENAAIQALESSNMIGQFVDINFISPKGSNPSGMYKAEIKHITKPEKGKHKGHCLAGIAILKNSSQHLP